VRSGLKYSENSCMFAVSDAMHGKRSVKPLAASLLQKVFPVP